MLLLKRYWPHFAAGLILMIFLFLRTYRLPQSLLFWGDMGRDYLVMLDWQKSGKPPLLGPQTSALPYNQSAVYFYGLMPLFLITNHSFFANNISLILFYVTLFAFGLWSFRRHRQLLISLLITASLMAIQPEFVRQARLVWNPSFTAPLVALAFYTFFRLTQKFSCRRLLLFALSLSLAVSLSYSIAPMFIAMSFMSLWLFRHHWRWLKLNLFLLAGLVFWNLPTLIFELRHGFFLTKLLITGDKLHQSGLAWLTKLTQLTQFSLPRLSHLSMIILLLLVVGGTYWSGKFRSQKTNQPLKLAWSVFLLTLLVSLLAPFGIAAHYIFAPLTLFFLIISFLPWRVSLLTLAIFSFSWLSPKQLQIYFQPAHRNLQASTACAQRICDQVRQPFFVSEQSGYHVYHNAVGWQYLFKNAGCQVRKLDTQIHQAQLMAVIVDHSSFQVGKTAYNELTQFGPAQEIKRLYCPAEVEVVLIEKKEKK